MNEAAAGTGWRRLTVRHEMPLSKRIFKCSCNGMDIDRDLHAVRNILRQGLPNVKPVERGALASA